MASKEERKKGKKNRPFKVLSYKLLALYFAIFSLSCYLNTSKQKRKRKERKRKKKRRKKERRGRTRRRK